MLSRGEERLLRRLHQRRFREAESRFLADGAKLVEDLVASALDVELVVCPYSMVDSPAVAAALGRGIEVREVAEGVVDDLAPTDAPQGVLAVAPIPAADPATVGWGDGVTLLLDAVQDPGNAGTLVRSAEAFAAPAVVAMPGTADLWNPKTIRGSAGSIFRVPVLRMDWEASAELLRRARAEIVGADMAGEPVAAAPGPAGLVVGNEGRGLSPVVRAGVDRLVSVPTPGPVESLNVASAASILLYALSAPRTSHAHP